jgi:malonyl-CoA O-methyltransferase
MIDLLLSADKGDKCRVVAVAEAEGSMFFFEKKNQKTFGRLGATPRPGVFVTGTDTGIGKTLVSACLAHRLGADYWKPAQTGTQDGDDDTATVAALARLPPERIHPPRHRFAAPLSPEAAAAMEGASIRLEDFTLPATHRPLVVEGAGGVLVPIGGGATMADLMVSLGLPVVLVARTTLGTINHTLLSLAALRARGLTVAGVVLVGRPNQGNRDAIAAHGSVRILAEIPWLDRIDADEVARLAMLLPDRLGEDSRA